MKKLWLLSPLAALLAGCPSSPPAGGGGGAEVGGGVVTAGEVAGTSGVAGVSVSSTCYDDLDCPSDQYCDFPEGDFEGTCQEGCRDDEACGEGESCDLTTHSCGLPSCEGDESCPDGSYCSDESTCEEGCRVGEACPGETAEDGRPLLCDPETRSCVPHSPCCVPEGDEERCVEAASATQCEAQGGQLLTGALLCSEAPCTARCELDVDCAELDSGELSFYCDQDDGRCREGCREGECGGDLICDPESRVCVNRSCASTDDCAEGQYCDPIDSVCLSGCGVDSDCPDGLGCVNNSCVATCDPTVEGSCGAGEYCDDELSVCRPSCERHEDCAESEACDPSSARCVRGACRDDEPLGDLSGEPNNSFESASNLTLVPVPSEPTRAIGRALERVICGADLDLYSLGLAQGERMRIRLNHDAGAELKVRLFNELDMSQPLLESEQSSNPDVIEYPAEGVVENAQRYYIEVSGMIDANERVGYELNVQTAPFDNACFSDGREEGEGDDDYEHATALVANGSSRFDDATVCVGDEDWYSLPLTVNDGLIVTVTTPIDARAVRFNLYSIAGFGGITGTPPATYSVGFEDSVEDLNSGQRVYSLVIDRDSEGFNIDGQWLLSVEPEGQADYATYQLTVVHESAGGVCVNEDREPNNEVSAGVDLEDSFGFPTDGDGLLSLATPHRVLDGVICAGDVDYYCLNLATGDKLSAAVSSDTVIGELEVSLVNANGASVGTSASHSPSGESEPAIFNGAPAGLYCVVVNGLGNAQGPYELTVTRDEGDDCVADGDDSSGLASELEDVSAGQGLRFERINALMCDPAVDSADWYSFNVAQDQSRVCVMLNGFDHDVADLDIELFGPPVSSGTSCSTDAQCQAENLSACIGGTCQIDLARSVFSYDFEMSSQPRVSVDAGEHYLRVQRGAVGAVSPYDLSVTVTPGRESCQDDWQELGDRNDIGGFDAVNVPSRATQLGSGAVGLCDAWICNYPGALPELDWYEITVPAEQDRTVIINFESESDGPLDLYYWGESATSMQEEILYAVSTTNTNYQCINIRGGSLELSAEIGVQVTGGAAGAFINDGDKRIDYSLRVVPTDLDANPAGACALFGAGAVDICDPNDPNDLFFLEPGGSALTETCWPEVALP